MKEVKMTKMSVTRALAEIKRIDEKLSRLSMEGTWVGIQVGRGANATVAGSNVEATSKTIVSSWDQFQSLLKNRQELKRKIVQSNAVTQLTVSGVQMSVAETIELKKSIESKRQLVNIMSQRYTQAINLVNAANTKLESTIETMVSQVLGTDKNKVSQADIDTVASAQKAQKEQALIDPLEIVTKINTMKDEISVVDTELDFLLSESNARTEIEVDF
jgi:hypothetical protein